MFSTKSLFAAFALMVASAVAAGPALAQGTKVVVIDQARVIAESAAGQDIAAKLAEIQGQMQRELEPTAQSLQSLGETIEARTEGATPESLQGDTELQAQARDYQTQLRNLNVESERRSTELAITERKARIAFAQALRPVLDEVMAEQGAQILLGADQVMIALEAVDVTGLVINKLNSSTPSIDVTRERLPEQAAQ